MPSGIDLISQPGTTVLAVMAGQVARVDTFSSYGLAVIVDPGNGERGKRGSPPLIHGH
jgi:murein DD-endopeptidase MepM/ murein hydrolase activator NlpD